MTKKKQQPRRDFFTGMDTPIDPAVGLDAGAAAAVADLDRREKRRAMTLAQRHKADHDEARAGKRLHLAMGRGLFAALKAEADALNVPRSNLAEYHLTVGLNHVRQAGLDLRTRRVPATGGTALRYAYVLEVPPVGDDGASPRRHFDLSAALMEALTVEAAALKVPKSNLAAYLLAESVLRARESKQNLREHTQIATGGAALRYNFELEIPPLIERARAG